MGQSAICTPGFFVCDEVRFGVLPLGATLNYMVAALNWIGLELLVAVVSDLLAAMKCSFGSSLGRQSVSAGT